MAKSCGAIGVPITASRFSAATSDHRPLHAAFETQGTSLRVRLLERLTAVEREVQSLRTAIEAIPE